MSTHQALATSSTSFLRLLDLYVTDRIPDDAWQRMTRVLDHEDAPPAERTAFGAFVADLVSQYGAEPFATPSPDEWSDLQASVRLA